MPNSPLSEVRINNLYQTVLDLHYERNPLTSPTNLEKAAAYLVNKFNSFGLQTEEHRFHVQQSENPYSNISAVINPGNTPELVVTSHYDHIIGSPGADDNLSGVSIMLELARIVSTLDIDQTIRFLCFTLEEGHPEANQQMISKGRSLGLLTDQYHATSYPFHMHQQIFDQKYRELRSQGIAQSAIFSKIMDKLQSELSSTEHEYLEFQSQIYEKFGDQSIAGFIGLVGSIRWVEDKQPTADTIAGVINLETCGYTSKAQYSQTFPPGLNPDQFPSFQVADPSIGNFISIIADQPSSDLGQVFFQQTQQTAIQLPSVFVGLPYTFDTILATMGDLLRSDHAPFWYHHIPALMITDTANFRNPYYHTGGDVITTLDFPFMKKVAQTTLATLLNL